MLLFFISAAVGCIWLVYGIAFAFAHEIDGGSQAWWEPFAIIFLAPIFLFLECRDEIISFIVNALFFTSPILICVILYQLQKVFS